MFSRSASPRPPIAPASMPVSHRVEAPAAPPSPSAPRKQGMSSATLATLAATTFALLSSALGLIPEAPAPYEATAPAPPVLRGTLAMNFEP